MLSWFKFFYCLTIINFLLVLFAPYVYKYIDLMFLSSCVCVIGLYISYISPGYFNVPFEDNIRVTGITKIIIDFVFHVMPLIYVYIFYRDYYLKNLNINSAIILVVLYAIFVDIEAIYNTNIEIVTILFLSIIVLYMYLQKYYKYITK